MSSKWYHIILDGQALQTDCWTVIILSVYISEKGVKKLKRGYCLISIFLTKIDNDHNGGEVLSPSLLDLFILKVICFFFWATISIYTLQGKRN